MNLALGTAQFGLPYGIANTTGQVSEQAVKKILYRAKESGVNTLDTAIAYGSSEKCLGNAGIEGWRVVTKLPEIPEECPNISEWVDRQIEESLSRLGLRKIMALMLHRPLQLLEPRGLELWLKMQELKDNKIVDKIGFSVYSPLELDLLLENYNPDIVQSPYSVLDQRLRTSGWLKNLHDDGVEVHVRSIFLQGLLLMSQEKRLQKFNQWKSLWNIWDTWLIQLKLSPLEACLGFVSQEKMIDCTIVGIDNLTQLNQMLSIVQKDIGVKVPKTLITEDLNLINPINWK